MKDCAIVWMFGALCAVGCTSSANPPSGQSNGVNSAGSMGTAVAGAAPPSMPTTMPAAGSGAAPTTPPATSAGSPASGAAGSTPASSAAGSGAMASGAAGKSAAAGEANGGMPSVNAGGATPGSFQYVYNVALRDLCTTCHTTMGLFSSPDLSNATTAYDSLVNKDASMMMPGQCTGKGKLITPGNCETSIIYSKLTQQMPICGRHMPLSSDNMPTFVPKESLDALCAWIKAGAKKD